ncbi:MAG: hypothetical protein HXY22_12755 [Alphaproteobacteria bacterium]|nr:hypothetical protein [Alphaproteobacteria bacterium]
MRGKRFLATIVLALSLGLLGASAAFAGPLANAAARKIDEKGIVSHALIQVNGWSGLGPLALTKVTVRALPPLSAPALPHAAGAFGRNLDPVRAVTILTVLAAILGAMSLLWRTWSDIDAADRV